MALIGSLNSGISALRNFARGLEVIGNNIANVNSTAFKGSRTKYTDSFSQFLKQPATSPTDGNGSNAAAAQIGLGVQIAGIQTSFLQGGLTTTGQSTDLAISGSGFFQVRNAGNNRLYATRAGDFRTDDRGYLTTNDGNRLQGLTGGFVSYDSVILNGQLSFRKSSTPPTATGDIRVDFNPTFDNGRLTNAPYHVDSAGEPILDGSGNRIPATKIYGSNAAGHLIFPADATGTEVLVNNLPVTAAAGTYLVDVNGALDLGDDGVPVLAPTDAEVLNSVPKMQAFSFLTNGDLNVFLTNGDMFVGGRVLLMDFQDPTALVREGANLFSGFDAAGVIGSTMLNGSDNTPGSYGLGVIQGGTLELSNVDLTEEFANIITTQRSFQAGSRIITVSDDILNEVVNLKR